VLEINIIIAIACIVSIAWALYKGYLLNKRRAYLTKISDELEKVLAKMNQLTGSLSSSQSTLFAKGSSERPGLEDLVDPHVLSTLITVLVKKYGNLYVGVNDFKVVKDEEYVSVYVDTSTNDIVLSIDHNLEQKNSITMANFTDPDDNTYH